MTAQLDLSDRKWRHFDSGRYDTRCRSCGTNIPAASNRAWHPEHGVWCWSCLAESQQTAPAAKHTDVPADDLDAHLTELEARHG